MKFRQVLTLIHLGLLMFLLIPARAQFGWWVEKHNWDGVTHWSQYIITSPAYMGPNALPVPEIRNGAIFPDAFVEMATDFHFSKGDDTQDLFGKLYVPLLDCKVALQTSAYIVEHYRTDEETRDERFARTFHTNGWAVGDIYFGAVIQILKDRGKWPDILFGANFKTASGGRLHDARYTDSPGYSFDISFGKSYPFKNNEHISLRPYFQLGFYVWQTHRVDYHQDDAFQYGGGVDLDIKNLRIANQLGGYSGYIGNGDKPLVYRLQVLLQQQKLNYKVAFQQGLNDYPYSSFRISVAWKFLN